MDLNLETERKITCWPHLECACDDEAAKRSRKIWRRLDQYAEACQYVVRPVPAIGLNNPFNEAMRAIRIWTAVSPDNPDYILKATMAAVMYCKWMA